MIIEKYNKIKSSKLYCFLRPYLNHQLLILFSILVSTVLSLQFPLVTKIIIDDVILGNNKKMLLIMLLVYIMLSLIGYLFTFLNQYMITLMVELLTFDIKKRLFMHFQKWRYSCYKKVSTGDIISNFNTDIGVIGQFFAVNVISILNNVLMIIVIVIILTLLNWRLALLSFLSIPLFYFSVKFTKGRIKLKFEKVRELVNEENKLLQDIYTNIKLVKLFALYKNTVKRFLQLQSKLISEKLKSSLINAMLNQVVHVIALISPVLILWYGTNLIIDSRLTIGGLTAFLTYTGKMYAPIRGMIDISIQYQKFIVSFDKISEKLDLEIEKDKASKHRIERGSIEFRNVSFAYDKEQILKNVSFGIKAGEKVAIIGSNGSGKTTLVNLLFNLYELDYGNITVDDIDIREFPVNYLRKSIGIVSQDMSFFNTSIRDNLTIVNTKCTEEDIVGSFEDMDAMDFIEKLPRGIDTVIGERGTNFSGGQLQKLSIIRLAMKKSKIIIFDEPTSSLDFESTELFYRLFDTRFKNKTVLYVTHDYRNLKYADKVILIRNGTVYMEHNLKRDLDNNELMNMFSEYVS